MTDSSTRNRQPKGVSIGGQYAPETKGEATAVTLSGPAPRHEPVIEPTGPAFDDERLSDETEFAAVVTQPALIDGEPGTIHAAYTTVDYGRVAVTRTTYLSREDLLSGHATGSPERLLEGAIKDYAYETILSLVDGQVDHGITMDFSGTPESPKPAPAAAPTQHSPSVGIVDTLPWPVPDLPQDVQTKLGLPADFTEAFDTYFADAAQALDAHDGDLKEATRALHADRDAALTGLCASYPQVAAKNFHIVSALPEMTSSARSCWVVDSVDDDGVTITWNSAIDSDGYGGAYWHEGPSLLAQDTAALEAAQTAQKADTTVHRMGQLQKIRSGEDAAWNFLPATHRQSQRAQTVREQNAPEIRELTRKLEEYDRTAWVEQHEGASVEQYRAKKLGEFVEVERTDAFTGRTRKVWAVTDGKNVLPVHDTREQVDAEVERSVARYAQDLARRAELAPVAQQQIARRDELRDTVRYYRQCAGWPGGDMSPQQSSDGSWHFYVQRGDGAGDWAFEEAPAKG